MMPTRITAPLTGAVLVVLSTLVLLCGCGVTGPVGPTPGSTLTAEPQTATPTYDGLKIEIFIDAESVTPLDERVEISRGRSVVLQLQSDHDVTVHVKGPQMNRSVFVGRLSTINSTFVVDQPGTVTITCEDPESTIATLVVT